MTQSNIGVSTGTDKYLSSNSRSIGGTALEEQTVLEGQSANPTYNIAADDVSTATAASHLVQIMADGTNYTRLTRLTVEPTEDVPAADSILKLALYRLSTAGTGGTALNDAPYDAADSYAGDMRTLPTSKGTEGQLLLTLYIDLAAAAYDGGRPRYVWTAPPGGKPIVFGNGTGAGIALKVIDAVASAAVLVQAEVITTAYL